MNESDQEEAAYVAFVSYARETDAWLARSFARALRRHETPFYRRATHRVFVDESALGGDIHLSSRLRDAAHRSSNLILLLSERAAESEWVNREIGWWLENHDIPDATALSEGETSRNTGLVLVHTRGIVARRVDGHFDWSASTALPPALNGMTPKDARVVDLFEVGDIERFLLRRRIRHAILDVRSAVHDVPRDQLENAIKKRLVIASVSSGLVVILMTFLVWQWSRSEAELGQAHEKIESVQAADWRATVLDIIELTGGSVPASALVRILQLLAEDNLSPEQERDLRVRATQALALTGPILGVYEASRGVRWVQYSDNGELLLVGDSHQANVYAVLSDNLVASLPLPEECHSLQLSPRGRYVAYANDDETTLWGVYEQRVLWSETIDWDASGSCGVAFSADDDCLIYWGDHNDSLSVRARVLMSGAEQVQDFPDSAAVIGPSMDDAVFLRSANDLLYWNFQTGERLVYETGLSGWVSLGDTLRSSSDIYYAVASTAGTQVFRWSPGEEHAKELFTTEGAIRSLRVEHSRTIGHAVVETDRGDETWVFDAGSGIRLGSAPLAFGYEGYVNSFLRCHAVPAYRHVYTLAHSPEITVMQPLNFDGVHPRRVTCLGGTLGATVLARHPNGELKDGAGGVALHPIDSSPAIELSALNAITAAVDDSRSTEDWEALNPRRDVLARKVESPLPLFVAGLNTPGSVVLVGGRLPEGIELSGDVQFVPYDDEGSFVSEANWAGDDHLLCTIRSKQTLHLFDVRKARWGQKVVGVRARSSAADPVTGSYCYVSAGDGALVVGDMQGRSEEVLPTSDRWTGLHAAVGHQRFIATGRGYMIIDSKSLAPLTGLEHAELRTWRLEPAVARDSPRALIYSSVPGESQPDSHRVHVVDLRTGDEEREPLRVAGPIRRMSLSEDGKRARICARELTLGSVVHSVYSLEDGLPLVQFRGTGTGTCSMSPSGDVLLYPTPTQQDPRQLSRWDLDLLDRADFQRVAAMFTGLDVVGGELRQLSSEAVVAHFESAVADTRPYVARVQRTLGIQVDPEREARGWMVLGVSPVGYLGGLLRPGDLLQSIGGKPITELHQASNLRAQLEAQALGAGSEPPILTIERDGRVLQLDTAPIEEED